MISLKNVGITFPVYHAKSRVFKNTLFDIVRAKSAKTQSNKKFIQALHNINFELKEGDRLAVLGHNGAGKSTLLRVLAGIYEPTRGNILIEGKITSLISISLGINDEATGRENIFIRGALLGLSRKQIVSYMDSIIEFAELGDFIDLPLRIYSSGMKMRLAFAIATSVEADIVLMDEWLSVGDENFKKKSEKRMQELIDKSKILVIATHSKSLATRMCTRALLLEKGEVKKMSSIQDVSEEYFLK